MQVTHKSRLILRIQSAIFFILFAAIIGCLGWLSHQYNFRSDWSYNARNSLSEETLALLKEIDSPINIRSYQPQHPLYEKHAKEIFSLYQRNTPLINFTLVDLNLEIDLAKADGITSEGQSTIKMNDKTEIINDLSEQSITNAILRLHRKNDAVLYFLTGHGERDISSRESIGYLALKTQLEEIGVKTKNINLLTDNLDDKTNNTLIIAAPEHELLEGEIKKILAFIDNGGNLLWLQDPSPRKELKAIADHLQVDFFKGVVIDNDKNLRETLGISHPAIIAILSYKLHPITEKMNYFTLFITAAAIKPQQNSAWKHTSLLLTQEESWTDTSGFLLDVKYDADKGDVKGPHSIGLALEKKTSDTNNNQRVVIIGDSDFIANNNLGQGANLKFIINTINWLTEDDDLISILPRKAPDTQLDLSETDRAIISLTFLIALPVLFAALGFYIWLRRQKR